MPGVDSVLKSFPANEKEENDENCKSDTVVVTYIFKLTIDE